MKKIRIPIFLATLYLLIYATTPYWTPEYITAIMYLFSPVIVIGLVLIILKKGEPSHLTFDEAFYEDYPAKTS
ncbi:MAG: hypothetical protein MUC49_00920 [Raineya sp.]|jgi:hypothetical protein|nr:hypothetical protein [Raineya sp.]